MSTYFIGDVHGCYKNLRTILDCVHFDPSIDILYLTGDLVSRGPSSLNVLRLIRDLKKSACTVLGNHDLYLLKTYLGLINHQKPNNHFDEILRASDSDELMNWLRHQPILYVDDDKKILMSHAGISPNWNIYQAKKYAQEIESILSSKYSYLLFKKQNKNLPKIVHNNNLYTAKKITQIQGNINIFTRIRYVHSNGQLNMKYKDIPIHTPRYLYPWFALPGLITPKYNIIFGHWASLRGIETPPKIYGLDSGCCWGGELTLLRWDDKKFIKIPCSPPA